MTIKDLLGAAEVYGWVGLGVALAFLTIGVGRVDPAARGAYAARVLLLPSVALLWPVVAIRWATIEFSAARSGSGRGGGSGRE